MKATLAQVVANPQTHRRCLALNNIGIAIYWIVDHATVPSVLLHGFLIVLVVIGMLFDWAVE